MKFILFSLFVAISFSSNSTAPSEQTFIQNKQYLDSFIVISFVDRANLACKTKDKKEFFNLFSYEVNFKIFRDKANRNKRYGISSHKGEKLERYMSIICRQFKNTADSELFFFQNPAMYEYGLLDYKERHDSSVGEPVLCVHQNNFCKPVLRAVIEKMS